jgi:hypothetical protein
VKVSQYFHGRVLNYWNIDREHIVTADVYLVNHNKKMVQSTGQAYDNVEGVKKMMKISLMILH